MTGRPRTVSDEAVFAAVAELVTQSGPSGITLGKVAQRVGVSAPALAQRFGSKHGLLVAFAGRGVAGVAEHFAAARAERPRPLAALRAALSGLPQGITTREAMANNLAFLQMDLTDPELREPAVTHSRAVRAEVAGLLREAVVEGELTPTTSPEELAEDLYTTYSGAMLTWAIDGSGALQDWLAERIDRILAPYRTQVEY
jgi:AcrR family transcriptional regulator